MIPDRQTYASYKSYTLGVSGAVAAVRDNLEVTTSAITWPGLSISSPHLQARATSTDSFVVVPALADKAILVRSVSVTEGKVDAQAPLYQPNIATLAVSGSDDDILVYADKTTKKDAEFPNIDFVLPVNTSLVHHQVQGPTQTLSTQPYTLTVEFEYIDPTTASSSQTIVPAAPLDGGGGGEDPGDAPPPGGGR
jgi:hypothetical protein